MVKHLGVILGVERLTLAGVTDGDFSVEDTFESFGNISAILHANANLGKASHIVVDLAVQVVLLRDLKCGKLEHELWITSQVIVDMLSIKLTVIALKCLAQLFN